MLTADSNPSYCVVNEPRRVGLVTVAHGAATVTSCAQTWYVVAGARGGTEYAAPAGCCWLAFGEGMGLGSGVGPVVTTGAPVGGVSVTLPVMRERTIVCTLSGIPVEPGADRPGIPAR